MRWSQPMDTRQRTITNSVETGEITTQQQPDFNTIRDIVFHTTCSWPTD